MVMLRGGGNHHHHNHLLPVHLASDWAVFLRRAVCAKYVYQGFAPIFSEAVS